MSTSSGAQGINNEFDAAREIVAILKPLDAQQRGRAIRFACESLDVQAPAGATQFTAGQVSQVLVTGAGANPSSAAPDIKQFSDSKAPQSDQQFAAIVAYFYRFVAPEKDRKEAITADDLKEAARLVGRKRPHRITLNNAKNAGYLDSAERGKFRISTVGENLVAVTLPGGAARPHNGAKRARKAKKVGSPRRRRSG